MTIDPTPLRVRSSSEGDVGSACEGNPGNGVNVQAGGRSLESRTMLRGTTAIRSAHRR